MKKIVWTLAVALAVAPAAVLFAHDPTINVTGPSGVQYVSSFPYSTTVTVQISHPTGQLSDLNVLDIKVTPAGGTAASILPLGPLGNPFNGNVCTSQMDLAHGVTGCAISAGVATVNVNWPGILAGSYSIQVVARHRSDEGDDVETVSFQLLSVEHPAPPAVANAYIKTLGKLPAKVHGCVISQIAEKHAKDSAYGPKGGPYNESWIQADVNTFRAICGG